MKILPLLVFMGTMLGSAGASANAVYLNQPLNAIDANVSVGSFEDYWTFDVGTPSAIAGQVNNSVFNFLGMFVIQNINDLTVDLRSTALGATTFNPLTYSVVAGDSNPSPTALTFSSLAAGSYALKVSGSGTGLAGGRYTGSLTVTPVPEPETWAMLLVGTILLGLQLRRKNVIQDSMLIAA